MPELLRRFTDQNEHNPSGEVFASGRVRFAEPVIRLIQLVVAYFVVQTLRRRTVFGFFCDANNLISTFPFE